MSTQNTNRKTFQRFSYTHFFYKQHFYKQYQAKLTKNQEKAKHHRETELLLLENVMIHK